MTKSSIANEVRSKTQLVSTLLPGNGSELQTKARRLSPNTIAEISDQLSKFDLSPRQISSLISIAEEEILFVVTGQQPGLFGGPLFVLYKAIGAINLANKLSKELGKKVVPLFWVQSEDHQRDELTKFNYLLEGKLVSESLQLPNYGERVSAADLILQDAEAEAIRQLLSKLELESILDEVQGALLRKSYLPGDSISASFTRLLLDVFRDTPLLAIDGRKFVSKCLDFSIWDKFISEQDEIARLVQLRSSELEELGFDIQVPIRDSSPLVVYHHEGQRYRLIFERGDAGGHYRLHGHDDIYLTKEEVLEDITKLGSTALSRPIFQDTLLPVVAYVGGDAEVAYLAQLSSLYGFFGLSQGGVFPRDHVILETAQISRLAIQLGLPVDDLLSSFGSTQAVKDRVFSNELNPDYLANLEGAREEIMKLLSEATTNLPNLERARSRTAESINKALETFSSKFKDELVNSDVVKNTRFEKLMLQLFPGGTAQERILPWIGFYSNDFMDRLLGSVSDSGFRSVKQG